MSNDSSARDQRLSLAELVDAAGVTVRTVRYYIAEGLLPAPRGTGPSSFYTRDHLDRLTLISRLKDGYLPLKEIKRRLSGVDEAEVRRLLTLPDAELLNPETWPHVEEEEELLQSNAARSYLEDMAPMLSAPKRRKRPNQTWDADEAPIYEEVAIASAAPPFLDSHRVMQSLAIEDEETNPATMRFQRASASQTRSNHLEELEAEPTSWVHLPIGDGFEFHIRQDLYLRIRADIDSLVRLARKLIR